ncbi:MAG: hypothetical protein QT05_C0012G0008 [archaeon GW2011_AR13]|nr:MAG: hypothetical protein QT05_C0012G0008 [archaeon GW2011_AR13]HIG94042.1 hypothetical protein [Nanoarchaeota archaeon]HIH63766.1 hypothetical protein [Nanoarchaeota archaeon]HIJ09639.1 hypothetical protein [Nanoarchaeota archaeon]
MQKNIENRLKKEKEILLVVLILIGFLLSLTSFGLVFAANPGGPDTITSVTNETKDAVSAKMFNISGGYVSTFNLSATIQNPRWKAFVGNVTGSFTLDDSAGSTIYDWSITTITGRVYATRQSGAITWASVNCSNATYLSTEAIAMNHNNSNDQLNKTFNASAPGTHSTFWVGAVSIPANTCPTINTYVNDVAQDSSFEEMALSDGVNTVYATILEEDVAGYDGSKYDFQMIVPEDGSPGFSGATAYYVYVEIGT